METKPHNKRQERRKTNVDISNMVYGKVPPQAKELEEAVLGAVMLVKSTMDTVISLLTPECFYVDAHQRIFRAMLQLHAKSSPVDLLTVVEQLKANEELEMVGGPYYVTKLTNSVVSTANIDAHMRIVYEKYLQREIIRLCGETLSEAYEDSADAFELLDLLDGKLTRLNTGHHNKSAVHIKNGMALSFTRINELRHLNHQMIGIPSGFTALDRVTMGWRNIDLIILAARPSVGKTAFALNLARNAAMNDFKPTPVLFFSMEMSTGQLIDRLMSAESEIWIEKISTGKLDDMHVEQLYKRTEKLYKSPVYFDDTPAQNILQLRSKARMAVRKYGVGIIIVDYLQLMSGVERKGNREQEISEISRGLKALAKELEIPVIALSQLSREPDKRSGSNKMPQLSDLRESGAIEQDADTVMFMYRPEYYNQTANEFGESTSGETHIRIAKHRNGKLDTIKVKALLHIQKFVDWDELGDAVHSLPEGGSWRPVASLDKSEEKPF
jgi:replicative DNA helicase